MSVAVETATKWQLPDKPLRNLPEDAFRRTTPFLSPCLSPRREVSAAEKEQDTPPAAAVDQARWKAVRRRRLAFVLGVAHFWVSTYWLGSYPSTFYKFYSLEAFVLFPLRWKSYKRMKMHYYMFDFCYLANLMLLAHLWLFPQSDFLFKVLFAYNSGPLAWSIVLFRNSLVYHSLAETTSLFMHWHPMLVSWTLRWYPNCTDRCEELIDGTRSAAELQHLLLWPMVPYLMWAVFYYVNLFVVSSKKIRDRGYETLYTYMLQNADYHLLRRIVYRFAARWRPLAYMCIHLLLVFVSLWTTVLWWNSFWAHSAWVAVATITSAWNGAAHYFE